MALHRMLYCSHNTTPGTLTEIAGQIEQILEVSRRNNGRDGVTGGLLYSAGCFAQVLEGPREAVENAFERIQCDERHTDVIVIMSGPVEARAFANWSMAFHDPSIDGNASAGTALEGAFAGRTATGDDLVALLHIVIANEGETYGDRAAA